MNADPREHFGGGHIWRGGIRLNVGRHASNGDVSLSGRLHGGFGGFTNDYAQQFDPMPRYRRAASNVVSDRPRAASEQFRHARDGQAATEREEVGKVAVAGSCNRHGILLAAKL